MLTALYIWAQMIPVWPSDQEADIFFFFFFLHQFGKSIQFDNEIQGERGFLRLLLLGKEHGSLLWSWEALKIGQVLSAAIASCIFPPVSPKVRDGRKKKSQGCQRYLGLSYNKTPSSRLISFVKSMLPKKNRKKKNLGHILENRVANVEII